jgi:hypothetical protein
MHKLRPPLPLTSPVGGWIDMLNWSGACTASVHRYVNTITSGCDTANMIVIFGSFLCDFCSITYYIGYHVELLKIISVIRSS